ncbi:hypothetical protein EDC65_4388 [Stella humosa]|uniref:Uncharacterized protein n=1 Tax=Stella humosa TaxID=94 RepID=A0A3N1KY70_9PROT|nr:hypothetical protein [Stella humosa]ROP83739.1 hypothetical protein EDC65_4388 [Stella humosa]BBK32999.1 hypothetical protein STHU_36330 [Stella humosa]
MWKVLVSMMAATMLCSAPSIAQNRPSVIALELNNNSGERKAFVTSEAVNVSGRSLAFEEMPAASTIRERLEFDTNATSGLWRLTLRVYGLDMLVEKECVVTLTLRRPLGSSSESTDRTPGTLCSVTFYAVDSERADLIVSFNP